MRCSVRLNVFVVLVCSSSCSDFQETDFVERRQKLVFDGLSVRQVSDQMISAGEIGLDARGRAERWQVAMAARATARVSQFTCAPDDPAECDACSKVSDEPLIGSGTMSSYTRLLTAHHGVLKPAEHASVNFELRALPHDTDADALEHWMLPNRLYSLGLQELARTDEVDEQDDLREWEFFKEKSYFTVDPTDDLGQDVVTMIPRPQTIETSVATAPLMGPGILFDSFSPAGREIHTPQPDEESWVVGVPIGVPRSYLSPFSQIDDRTPFPLSVVSWPGFVASPGAFRDLDPNFPDEDLDYCGRSGPKKCVETGLDSSQPQWTNAIDVIYEGCYSTSNDAAPGMSGGAGLARRPEQDENRRLRILGVNSSVSPIPGAGSLVEEHWTGGDVVTASPTPGFSASVSGSTANFALRLARLTPAIQTDASRDYDYDFRQLPPNTQPADFGVAEGANPEGLLSSTFTSPVPTCQQGAIRRATPNARM